MKFLQNLKGVKTLNKKEQQSINGGLVHCGSGSNSSCNADADCCGTCMIVVGQTIGTCRNKIY